MNSMESGRFLFDRSVCQGNMLFLGSRDSLFGGGGSAMGIEEATKRRSIFSYPDELFNEEYYDDQSPEKKRRLTPEQVHLLEKSFEAENKLEPEKKTQLAKKLGMQPRQVAVWFQNRRARWKTKQLERDYDVLKSSYDSLLSNYDSIKKENEKLKSEVNSLNEKLSAKDVAGALASGQSSHALREEETRDSSLGFVVKVEDRLSSGSGGSAVVDEDGPQLVDSGHSYFHCDGYPGCLVAIDGVQSEEDDGSDDGRVYCSGIFAAAEEPHQEGGEPLGWWAWP
ncbi:hypothetical protein NL676_006152 [Syzygium grande]|nr:hypothetical protein NL676_006152 [Syzygium grande]